MRPRIFDFTLPRDRGHRAQGEFHFMAHEGTVTAAVSKRSLQRLLVGAKRPISPTVDRHPTHKSKLVRTYVKSTERT